MPTGCQRRRYEIISFYSRGQWLASWRRFCFSLRDRGVCSRYYWEFLADVCRLVPKILTLFQTKKCYFPTCSQTWPLKSIPVFRPGLWANFLSSLLRLDGKPKKSSNAIRSRIFLFRSYSFGIDTINTFILSLVPLKTIPDSRTK